MSLKNVSSHNEPESSPLHVEVGNQIKRIRLQRGWSIQELARRSHVSIGLISQIERGKSSPSLSTVTKIRTAFNVPVSMLFSGTESEALDSAYVRRIENRPVISFGDGKMHKELLSPQPGSPLQMMLLRVPAGQGAGGRSVSDQGQKGGLVIKGFLKLRVGENVFGLRPGDSFQFDSSLPHSFENTRKVEAQILWIVATQSDKTI